MRGLLGLSATGCVVDATKKIREIPNAVFASIKECPFQTGIRVLESGAAANVLPKAGKEAPESGSLLS
jgi:hypothetical protein